MHLKELVTQPVNLIVSVLFVLFFGLIITSAALDNAGYPNPVTSFGAMIALAVINHQQQ
jgi:hypothetical protein